MSVVRGSLQGGRIVPQGPPGTKSIAGSLSREEYVQISWNQGNLWARYRVGSGTLKGMSFGLGFTAIGDRRDDSRPLGFYTGFHRFDFNANYPINKHFSASLNVKNLTDEVYWSYRDRRGQSRAFIGALRYTL